MKKIVAKVGEYQKDGQTKGRYVDVGVIMANDNGEYVMLDPSVNLAGVLLKQQTMATKAGKQIGDSIMCSIFENQGQVQQPQQGFQQQSQQGYNNQAPQQGGFQQQQGGYQVPNDTF